MPTTATVKYSTPGTTTANQAGTTLNSLANGSASAFVTFDNSTNRDPYANARITLGSITPSSGGTVTFCLFSAQDANAPDNTASVGGGDRYVLPLTTGASIKELNLPMIRLYPESLRWCIVNNAGVSLAASGNALTFSSYDEESTTP